MLSSLNLKNFKPFENQFVAFKPLTFFSGLNSTGKSSLLQSLCHSNENSKKRYGYHKTSDKFYVFHSENTFDEKGYPTYHGFPISEDQVPNETLAKIRK